MFQIQSSFYQWFSNFFLYQGDQGTVMNFEKFRRVNVKKMHKTLKCGTLRKLSWHTGVPRHTSWESLSFIY